MYNTVWEKQIKNVKRTVLILVVFALSIYLSGCRLANPEKQSLTSKENFIGVFVVFDDDLKDFQMMDGDTLYNQEKKLVRKDGTSKILSDKEMKQLSEGSEIVGVKQEDGTYRFGDIQGYYVGYHQDVTKSKDNTPCIAYSTQTSNDVYDTHVSLNSNSTMDCSKTFTEDEEPQLEVNIIEQSITVDGTIPVSSLKERIVKLIGVHQRQNGEVYINLPAGPSLYLNPSNDMEGLSRSEKYESSMKSMGLLDQSAKESITFNIQFKKVDPLLSAKAIEMNRDNQVLKSTDMKFNARQLNLKLDQKTAYVIIEETFKDREGNTYQKRTAYDGEQIGSEEWGNGNTHTFNKTMKNKKIQRITLTFVR